MSRCAHRFELHVGLVVHRVGQRRVAWVPVRYVDPHTTPIDSPTMQRCVSCGEQGYAIPA